MKIYRPYVSYYYSGGDSYYVETGKPCATKLRAKEEREKIIESLKKRDARIVNSNIEESEVLS